MNSCDTCIHNERPCMFVSKFRSVRSNTQEKAHAILCGNCKCVDSVTGKCKRISNLGCPNYLKKDEEK